jgi:hypothetical protein
VANINGVNPPPERSQTYVQDIIDSFTAVDTHDHTSGKGVPLPTAALADSAVTTAKIADLNVTGGKLAATLSGDHVWSGDATFQQDFALSVTLDATAGAIAQLSAANRSIIRLSAATIIQGIGNGVSAKVVLLMNATGADATIAYLSGSASAADRIDTGTGSDFRFKNNSMALLAYDGTSSVWRLVGGGSSGTTVSSNFTGTTVTVTADASQKFRYTGSSAQTFTAITLTAAVDGAEYEFVGTDDTNTITIPFADSSGNFLINGDWTGYRGSSLRVRYDATANRLFEVARSL